MADLYSAINQIIGSPSDTVGFRYYVNWSTTAVPGAGATHALNVKRKVESVPRPFTDDPDNDYPGVFIEKTGPFPSTRLVEKHYDCSFSVNIYYVAKAIYNQRPREEAREMIVKITDNIMASNKLGLTFLDSLQWDGFQDDNEIVRIFPLVLPEYYAAVSRFTVKASVTF